MGQKDAESLKSSLSESYHIEELGVEALAMMCSDDKALGFFGGVDRKRVKDILAEIEGDERRHIGLLDGLISSIEEDCDGC